MCGLQATHTCGEGGGIIKEGIIPMQEVDSQRGEGAYFRRGAYFRGNTVLLTPYQSSSLTSIKFKLAFYGTVQRVVTERLS